MNQQQTKFHLHEKQSGGGGCAWWKKISYPMLSFYINFHDNERGTQ